MFTQAFLASFPGLFAVGVLVIGPWFAMRRWTWGRIVAIAWAVVAYLGEVALWLDGGSEPGGAGLLAVLALEIAERTRRKTGQEVPDSSPASTIRA